MPALEFSVEPVKEEKLIPKKASVQSRSWHMFSTIMVGIFFGVLVGLYIMGFMSPDRIPNIYGIAFLSLLNGFMVASIANFLDKVDLSRFLGSG